MQIREIIKTYGEGLLIAICVAVPLMIHEIEFFLNNKYAYYLVLILIVGFVSLILRFLMLDILSSEIDRLRMEIDSLDSRLQRGIDSLGKRIDKIEDEQCRQQFKDIGEYLYEVYMALRDEKCKNFVYSVL